MPGRKETLSGNRFPSTTTVAMTANSTNGQGLDRSDRPTGACATNSHSTPKIMNTFHSSGTPIGKASRMLRWKMIITNAAIAVVVEDDHHERGDRGRPAAV